MNLLIITQKVDEEDDLLGFFVDWIREFSKRFDKVFVITLTKGSYRLPQNVHVYSLGKEKNNSRIVRIFNYYRFLFRLMPQTDGIFAHMSPVFAITSWPAAFVFRKKIILWYLHRSVTLRLKIAEKLSYKIVTASKESLNLQSRKIIETGHGINADNFKTVRTWEDKDRYKILSVGRISPIKNFETIINAAAILRDEGLNFEINIIGKPVMSGDSIYFEFLKSLVSKLKLGDQVKFTGYVPYSGISSFYKEADFFVGPLPRGGVDKAMLEAMASGCITLTSNTVFRKYFGKYADELTFSDAKELALKLKTISTKPGFEKKDMSDFMVNSVRENHDLKNLIDKICKLYE